MRGDFTTIADQVNGIASMSFAVVLPVVGCPIEVEISKPKTTFGRLPLPIDDCPAVQVVDIMMMMFWVSLMMIVMMTIRHRHRHQQHHHKVFCRRCCCG